MEAGKNGSTSGRPYMARDPKTVTPAGRNDAGEAHLSDGNF